MDADDREFLLAMGGSPVASFGAQGLFDLKSYYEATEVFLASSEMERRTRIQSARDQMDSEMRGYLLSSESSLLWEDYFPSELRATVLVAIMSFFERYLNGVCAEVGMLVRTKISHKKLKGSALDRAKTFLLDLCALNGPRVELWDEMRQLQQLRNLLVHNGGVPDSEQEKKRAGALADAIAGVVATEFGLDLETQALRHAFERVEAFMGELEAAASAMCEHVKRFENET